MIDYNSYKENISRRGDLIARNEIVGMGIYQHHGGVSSNLPEWFDYAQRILLLNDKDFKNLETREKAIMFLLKDGIDCDTIPTTACGFTLEDALSIAIIEDLYTIKDCLLCNWDSLA